MNKLKTALVSLVLIFGLSACGTGHNPRLDNKKSNSGAGSFDNADEFYYKGRKAVKSHYFTEAHDAWLQAANQGHSNAQYGLGVLYERGDGVTRDLKEAARWFTLAAKQDHSLAQYKLGIWYLNGLYFEKDILLAKKWFVKSASQNNIDSITQLVRVSYREQNAKELLKWVNKGIELGSSNAIYVLSMIYRNGFLSIEANIKEANKLLVQAAESGSPEAQHKLGVYYREGVFFDKILERAFFWFSKSANQGYADAKLAIGLMYFDGNYLKQDYKKAISLFEEVASQGNVDAYGLLTMAYIGPGTEIYDIEKAKYWMKKSADAGHPTAIEFIKEYESKPPVDL